MGQVKLKSQNHYQNNMSTEPSRLTEDERKKLTRIPDNTETRDVLENLLFSLSLMGILTDDNIHQIIRNR
jgi:hypothetical protein